MDIYAIRLQNIRSLIGTMVKNRTELSEKLEMAYELLSNYIGKNPSKNVGDEVARRVEQAFPDLPYGWMDNRHDIAAPTHTDSSAANERLPDAAWPFITITPYQWQGLDDFNRGRVEQLALELLKARQSTEKKPGPPPRRQRKVA